MATVTLRKSTRVKKPPRWSEEQKEEEDENDSVKANSPSAATTSKKRSLSGYSMITEGKRRKTEPTS